MHWKTNEIEERIRSVKENIADLVIQEIKSTMDASSTSV